MFGQSGHGLLSGPCIRRARQQLELVDARAPWR